MKVLASASGYAEGEDALSVSELVGLLKETLETQFAEVLVVGELVSFKRHHLSGHCYFSLADDDAGIDAVMWRGSAARLGFTPQAGDEVLCRGYIGVYERQGRMQLYVSSMRPVGAGAAQRAVEALRRKLDAEGLFAAERKRPLPFFPGTVGVVTSKSGAAIGDILTTLHRRFPACHVLVSPAAVQGNAAPAELVAALALLAQDGRCDVAIVGRGGGAAEDLAAFNDEDVVRAVAAFPVPIVSAVGHEMDTSLCDLAADRRAATPTAAAEAVVPVLSEITETTKQLDVRLHGSLRRRVESLHDRVGAVRGRLRDPAFLIARVRQQSDELALRLERSLLRRYRGAETRVLAARAGLASSSSRRCEYLREVVHRSDRGLRSALDARVWKSSTRVKELYSRLQALSPLAVLDRGYSLTMTEDAGLVRSWKDVKAGQTVRLRFAVGQARASIVSVSEEDTK